MAHLTDEERKARMAVRMESLKKSIRGERCAHCGKTYSEARKCGRLERHHPSYESTDFIVLCTQCHSNEHMRIKGTNGHVTRGRMLKYGEETACIRLPGSLAKFIQNNMDLVREVMEFPERFPELNG